MDEPPTPDTYSQWAGLPEAYLRIYISDAVGWKTVYGGPDFDEIDDVVDAYEDQYG